jgi:GAF domain-containing protein
MTAPHDAPANGALSPAPGSDEGATSPAVASGAGAASRAARYAAVRASLDALLEGETDWVAAMATVVCELHHAFEHYDWTGFYRAVDARTLVIGPYQGGHGCLRIDFGRGVCGAAARTRQTQLVPDVSAFPDHIACSSTTRSEIVVPVLRPDGSVLAVLDVDSDSPAAFDEVDRAALEDLCGELGRRFGGG